MAGGKLARLLQAVGGGNRDEQRAAGPITKRVRAQEANGSAHKSSSIRCTPAEAGSRRPEHGLTTSSTAAAAASDAPARIRKRRRGGSKKAAPAKAPVAKRSRREAGPATKAALTAAAGGSKSSGAGGAVPAAEDLELLEAERQKLLAGRSAYEALMDELSRVRHDGGKGSKAGKGSGSNAAGAGGGGGGGAQAALRAHLQRLRNEQLGESS
ncbi:hypothetical protein Agub_g2306, partial [Astrephomene gubernaculifera]